tara:strand:+ start:295 stop:477 length:183 start_codon:yes stop_codon:yes gene_type:complete
MNHEDKSRTGFIRAMAREIIVNNLNKISIAESIETSRNLYDQTYNSNSHSGEKNGNSIKR